MNQHVREAARTRYGLLLDETDLASIDAQCRAGCNLLRRFSNASEHHAVRVRGIPMCALVRRGTIMTVLPRDWLRHDCETALGAAFQRAGIR